MPESMTRENPMNADRRVDKVIEGGNMYILIVKCGFYHSTNPIVNSLNFKLSNPSNCLMHAVQFSSVAQSCLTLRDPMNRRTPGLPVHHQVPEFTQIHVHRVSAISSSVVPFSSCPQSLPASVFSNESTLRMRWPKYWSFSFSIISSKEIPGLISFRMDWLDLLAVQFSSVQSLSRVRLFETP